MDSRKRKTAAEQEKPPLADMNDPPQKPRETSVDICKQFLMSTTLKGASRVIKTRSLSWRFIWFLAVISGISFAAYNLALILKSYYSYNTTTKMRETYDPSNLKLPTITICNLKPLRTRAPPSVEQEVIDLGIKFEEVLLQSNLTKGNQTQNKINNNNSIKSSEYDYEIAEDNEAYALLSELLDSFNTVPNYFQNLNSSSRKLLGQPHEFVVSCKWSGYGMSFFQKPTCDLSEQMKITEHPELFNCFSIDSTKGTPSRTYHKLSLILFLDNLGEAMAGKRPLETRLTSDGILAYIHPPGSRFDSEDPVITSSPGPQAFIQIKTKKYTFQPHPYGSCIKDPAPFHTGNSTNETYIYRSGICMSSCHQKEAVKRCGCVDPNSFATDEQIHRYPYCGALAPVDVMATRSQCLTGILLAPRNCSCPLKCNSVGYDVSVSQATWPRPAQHDLFMKTLVKEKYRDAFNDYINSFEEEVLTYQDIKYYQERFISSNFINLEVEFASLYEASIEDVPETNVPTLLSKIGGVLNLWSGITVMLLVELAEFLFSLGYHWLFGCNDTQRVRATESVNT